MACSSELFTSKGIRMGKKRPRSREPAVSQSAGAYPLCSHNAEYTHQAHTHISPRARSIYQRKLTKALFFVCGMKENKKRESRDDCGNVLLTITSIPSAAERPWIFILYIHIYIRFCCSADAHFLPFACGGGGQRHKSANSSQLNTFCNLQLDFWL